MNKKTVSRMIIGLSVISALVGACLVKGKNQNTDIKTSMVEKGGHSLQNYPGGAGVLLKDNQIVLIPQMTENRSRYEKRLLELNKIAPLVGTNTFVTIINHENKQAYDAFMFDFCARQGKVYNMILNPYSSWASMQIGGGQAVEKYTPYDILKAQKEMKEKAYEK